MAGKTTKKQKQIKPMGKANTSQRTAQIMFAIFAVILILSMVLSAVANY